MAFVPLPSFLLHFENPLLLVCFDILISLWPSCWYKAVPVPNPSQGMWLPSLRIMSSLTGDDIMSKGLYLQIGSARFGVAIGYLWFAQLYVHLTYIKLSNVSYLWHVTAAAPQSLRFGYFVFRRHVNRKSVTFDSCLSVLVCVCSNRQVLPLSMPRNAIHICLPWFIVQVLPYIYVYQVLLYVTSFTTKVCFIQSVFQTSQQVWTAEGVYGR